MRLIIGILLKFIFTFFNFDLFFYNFDILFSYSNKQDRPQHHCTTTFEKKPTKLSVPFSSLMYCLNTKLTIDSFNITRCLMFTPSGWSFTSSCGNILPSLVETKDEYSCCLSLLISLIGIGIWVIYSSTAFERSQINS